MTTSTVTGLEALLEQLGVKVPIRPFLAADVLKRPLDIGRSHLADIFCSLVECDPEVAYKSIHWPNDISSGDLAVILPKLSHGADSGAVGFDIRTKFPERSLFMLPFQDGVHLRIMFSPQTLPRLLIPYMNDRRDSYGRDDSLGLRDPSSPETGRKKLLVEFSSPNIASEFQARHLRSTIIGAYIANQYENLGWDVTRLNYLGDWGKPMGLLGVAWEKFGSEEIFQADPVGHLHDIYHKIQELFAPEQAASKKIRDEGGDPASIEGQGLFAERNAFFKRMEDGDDEQAVALWKRAREVNIKNYTELYSRLNVSFDEYSGESQVRPETMAEVEEILKSRGISEESAGSWMIDLKKHAKGSGTAIIRDRTGSSTYLLRDLAAVLERARKYSFDKMIYVVAADQHTTHFSRLFKILELMDMSDLASKLQHVHFNNVSKMSEKLGHDHTLDEILDQFQKATYESLKIHPEMASLLGLSEESISSIAISALVAGELSTRRGQDHAFEVTRMTSFEPGTGPHLQYWYARLCTILNADSTCIKPSQEEFDPLSDDYFSLLRLLVQFPDITHLAYESLEPTTIMAYLVNLAVQLEVCFDECENKVVDSPTQVNLYEATRRVMETGMKFLGIIPVRAPDGASTPEGNLQLDHLTLSEENKPEDAQPSVEGIVSDEETPVSDNAQISIETTSSDSTQVLDEVQVLDNTPALDGLVAPEDVIATEVHSLSKEMTAGDEQAPEAIKVCEEGTPHDNVQINEEVAVPEEHVPEAIEICKEVTSHDIVQVNEEVAILEELVPEASQSFEAGVSPHKPIEICEEGTPYDIVQVNEEVTVPEEHVPEASQSPEEGVSPHEPSSSVATGTLDDNVPEKTQVFEEKSLDVSPASDDVSESIQHDSQDALIPEGIKPSVEIQVM